MLFPKYEKPCWLLNNSLAKMLYKEIYMLQICKWDNSFLCPVASWSHWEDLNTVTFFFCYLPAKLAENVFFDGFWPGEDFHGVLEFLRASAKSNFSYPTFAVSCCEIFLYTSRSYPAFCSHNDVNVTGVVKIKYRKTKLHSLSNFWSLVHPGWLSGNHSTPHLTTLIPIPLASHAWRASRCPLPCHSDKEVSEPGDL